jgi:hypothetical protein
VSNVAGAGGAGVCARLTGGRLACLDGWNTFGELGLGGVEQWRINMPAPTPTSPFNSPTFVIAPA